jgi:hypothetical protein
MINHNNLSKSTKEKILVSDICKAAKIAFHNGCIKGYDLEAMAHYMFLEGIKYQKTGEIPEKLY